MSPEQKLRHIVENAIGDNLERARFKFQGMSDKQLDEPHGFSGMTRRQVLQVFENERRDYLAAKEFLNKLLGS